MFNKIAIGMPAVVGAIVILCLLIFVLPGACEHDRKARERMKAERTERCTDLCERHEGMYMWWHKQGWGGGAYICICNSGTEIQLP